MASRILSPGLSPSQIKALTLLQSGLDTPQIAPTPGTIVPGQTALPEAPPDVNTRQDNNYLSPAMLRANKAHELLLQGIANLESVGNVVGDDPSLYADKRQPFATPYPTLPSPVQLPQYNTGAVQHAGKQALPYAALLGLLAGPTGFTQAAGGLLNGVENNAAQQAQAQYERGVREAALRQQQNELGYKAQVGGYDAQKAEYDAQQQARVDEARQRLGVTNSRIGAATTVVKELSDVEQNDITRATQGNRDQLTALRQNYRTIVDKYYSNATTPEGKANALAAANPIAEQIALLSGMPAGDYLKLTGDGTTTKAELELLNQANALKRTTIGANATVKSAQIGAGVREKGIEAGERNNIRNNQTSRANTLMHVNSAESISEANRNMDYKIARERNKNYLDGLKTKAALEKNAQFNPAIMRGVSQLMSTYTNAQGQVQTKLNEVRRQIQAETKALDTFGQRNPEKHQANITKLQASEAELSTQSEFYGRRIQSVQTVIDNAFTGADGGFGLKDAIQGYQREMTQDEKLQAILTNPLIGTPLRPAVKTPGVQSPNAALPPPKASTTPKTKVVAPKSVSPAPLKPETKKPTRKVPTAPRDVNPQVKAQPGTIVPGKETDTATIRSKATALTGEARRAYLRSLTPAQLNALMN